MVALKYEEVEDILEEDEPGLLKRYRRESDLAAYYPKPSEADIQEVADRLYTTFREKRDEIVKTREVRYMRDDTPPKWKKGLANGTRYHAGLINNELRRVVAIITGNLPDVHIQPAGPGSKAKERADKQTQWANAVLPQMEREHGQLLRPFGDGLGEAGYAAFEVYFTGTYDDLDTEKRLGETPGQYRNRMHLQAVQVGSPIGVRVPDPLSLYFEPYTDDPEIVVIRERKSRRHVVGWARANGIDTKKIESLDKRKKGPISFLAQAVGEAHDSYQQNGDMVDTIRYYDHCWMAYAVDGHVLQVEKHGFPRLPVIISDGMITSSGALHERLQAVVTGMVEDERVVNDLMTLTLDNAYRFSKPKTAIISKDANASPQRNRQGGTMRIDLTADSGAPVLPPGYEVQDITAQHRPYETSPVIGQIMANFQRKGLNPIQQGESPGADPAGYTVNTLITTAQRMYDVLPECVARSWGRVIDLIRLTIRDSEHLQGQEVFMSNMLSEKGGQWLPLGKNDVTDVPSQCVIDPLNDQNRMAKIQVLKDGVQLGAIAMRRLQKEGYKVQDVGEEDRQIIRDKARMLFGDAVLQSGWQVAQNRMLAAAGPTPAPPQPPQIVGLDGQPISSNKQNGGTPYPNDPPTVGGGTQGRERISSSAGQQPVDRGG